MTVRDLGSARITCAMTPALAQVSAGAFTVAAVARKLDTDWRPMVSFVNDGGSPRRSPWCSGDSDRMSVDTGGSDFFAPTTVTPGDGWCLLVWGKPAGESALVCSKLVLSTGVWTHNSGDMMDDNSATPDGEIHLGAWQSFRWGGLCAAIASWTEHLDQSAREALAPGLSAWLDAEPDALWPLTQESIATPVEDVTGNGSDQIAIEAGTSVVTDDDPPNFSLTLAGEVVEAAVSLTAAGTTTAAARPVVTASAALTATTDTGAAGRLVATGTARLASSGQASAAARVVPTGQAHLTGTVILQVAPEGTDPAPTPASRTIRIPRESRTVAVPAERRTLVVEAETREVVVA